MKKLLSCLFALVILLSMNSCGASGGNSAVKNGKYDVDRLYGRWVEENGSKVLIFTSERLKLSDGSSSSSTTSSYVETGKDTVSFHFNNLDEMTIEEKEDGTLRISNDQVAFVQKENWSEANIDRTADPLSVALKEKITTNFAEIVFEKQNITNELKISSTSGGGGGYGGHITVTQILAKEEAGKKVIYLEGTVKNTAAYSVEPSKMKVKLVINGKYELTGKADVVTRGADRVYNMDPLNSATIYLHVMVDSSAITEITTMDWYIGFEEAFSGNDGGEPGGSKYYYKISTK